MLIKPENIYKYRAILNPLYTQDIRFESDLVDSIYSVLDDTNLIESYNFDLYNSNISVIMIKEAQEKDYCSIVQSIQDTIVEYIQKNLNHLDTSKLNREELEEFKQFCSTPNLLYEFYVMGRQINVTL